MRARRVRARGLAAAALGTLLLVVGCLGVPAGIEPVHPFDLDRYLGTWYELARYDHRFERGLTSVTATYARRPDGRISVRNRGFDETKDAWREAAGVASPVGPADVGHLKVSFFGPFYASYVVFALDPDYGWAWVTGPDRGYLWLLSREPVLGPERMKELMRIAQEHGFDTDELIRVEQEVVAGR